MTLTQATREITIETPLGKDALLLRSFRGQESLSQLFEFELDLASENSSIEYDNIIGQNITIAVTLADGSERYWNGFVSRFVQMHRDSVAAAYRATMVPWLWFLSQTADCRIFQNKTVPELVKAIFQRIQLHGLLVSALRRICDPRLLRSVPGVGSQLHLQTFGRRGHLLLL